jgi:hypothetical protein
MVRGMCGGTTISSEGRWDLTNRWIGNKKNQQRLTDGVETARSRCPDEEEGEEERRRRRCV